MQFNQLGLDLLKRCEGCRLAAYQDAVGIWTIGYGHTGAEVEQGLQWTQQQADEMLALQVHAFAAGAQHLIARPDLSDNQFSAIVVFAYNVGLRTLGGSSALKSINDGDLAAVPAGLLLYDKGRDRAGNLVVLPGLQDRRRKEVGLWNTSGAPTNAAGFDPAPPLPTSFRTMRAGDRGEDVRTVQHLLIARGHFMDGDYGPQTERAVRSFQVSRSLQDDGVVGPTTWAALTTTV